MRENLTGFRELARRPIRVSLNIASVAIAYGAFRFLHWIGTTGWFLEWLERMHQIAIVIVFARFLYSVVRRSFTPSV